MCHTCLRTMGYNKRNCNTWHHRNNGIHWHLQLDWYRVRRLVFPLRKEEHFHGTLPLYKPSLVWFSKANLTREGKGMFLHITVIMRKLVTVAVGLMFHFNGGTACKKPIGWWKHCIINEPKRRVFFFLFFCKNFINVRGGLCPGRTHRMSLHHEQIHINWILMLYRVLILATVSLFKDIAILSPSVSGVEWPKVTPPSDFHYSHSRMPWCICTTNWLNLLLCSLPVLHLLLFCLPFDVSFLSPPFIFSSFSFHCHFSLLLLNSSHLPIFCDPFLFSDFNSPVSISRIFFFSFSAPSQA